MHGETVKLKILSVTQKRLYGILKSTCKVPDIFVRFQTKLEVVDRFS